MFTSRVQAGRQLANRLLKYKEEKPIIVAIPRGGVPVALEVAKKLKCPLDVLVVKKLGAPNQPELAVGALTEGGISWTSEDHVAYFRLSPIDIQKSIQNKEEEIKSLIQLFRDGRPLVDVRNRTVIVVDDGLATGATAFAATRALRKMGASKIIFAAPVASAESAVKLRDFVDASVFVAEDEFLMSVSQWYKDFSQVSNTEVLTMIESYRNGEDLQIHSRPVVIESESFELRGELRWPEQVKGWMLFAHGSGSSHKSPRNQKVASELNHAGYGTLLFDLLTHEEEGNFVYVFDIGLLAERLLLATDFLKEQNPYHDQPIAYFGASTGAAAALTAAARLEDIEICAVVSRGGRPDLTTQDDLEAVKCPVLLITGSKDDVVIELNEKARKFLPMSEAFIVDGASHLFTEPGALEQVSGKVIRWLNQVLETPSEYEKAAQRGEFEAQI